MPERRARGLYRLPVLTTLVMLGPVLAGLIGTIAPATGLMTTIGGTGTFSLDSFVTLFGWLGLPAAARLSVVTGLVATALSLSIVVLVVAGWHGTKLFRLVERLLSPLLSVPHAAAAFGIAFLIAPSGWISRAFSPWLTGWDRPPDLLIVQDPAGIAMIVGLVAKEVPFLLLMILAALGQGRTGQTRTVAMSMGYGRITGWLKTVFPGIYRQIRLPVYVVLAYSMSVVDVAMILGPNTPPTLSVQIVRWRSDPDLALRATAAAGALLQLGLVVAALLLWWFTEELVGRVGQRWIWRGGRGARLSESVLRLISIGIAGVLSASILLGIVGLMVWSVAGFWAFPDILPDQLTLRSWLRFGTDLWEPIVETALIAVATTGMALFLTIGCLEAEYRYGLQLGRRGLWLIYLPLLIPQIAFLPGLQILLLKAGASGGRMAVIFAHVVFVLPYVFLSLSAPFRAWDARIGQVAHALGAGPDRVLWQVRLPMLLAPVLTATAVGLSVSVGQYLPTLLIGGGRVQTLTTEALALASGGDRRAIGVLGLLQTLAALLPFAMALYIPRIVWRQRKGVLHG